MKNRETLIRFLEGNMKDTVRRGVRSEVSGSLVLHWRCAHKAIVGGIENIAS